MAYSSDLSHLTCRIIFFSSLSHTWKVVEKNLPLKCDGTRWRTGGEVKVKLANGVGSQYLSHYLGTWCIQHYYRLCAHLGCQWSTELTPPADLNRLVRFACRWNLVSARVPSHFNCLYLYCPLEWLYHRSKPYPLRSSSRCCTTDYTVFPLPFWHAASFPHWSCPLRGRYTRSISILASWYCLLQTQSRCKDLT